MVFDRLLTTYLNQLTSDVTDVYLLFSCVWIFKNISDNFCFPIYIYIYINKTKQNKTKQNKTKQNKTKQNKKKLNNFWTPTF